MSSPPPVGYLFVGRHAKSHWSGCVGVWLERGAARGEAWASPERLAEARRRGWCTVDPESMKREPLHKLCVWMGLAKPVAKKTGKKKKKQKKKRKKQLPKKWKLLARVKEATDHPGRPLCPDKGLQDAMMVGRIVVRDHASLRWDDGDEADDDADAPKLGVDLVISTPAVRAHHTAGLVAGAVARHCSATGPNAPWKHIVTDASLWPEDGPVGVAAYAEAVTRHATAATNTPTCVWIFGHNPDVSDVVETLAGHNVTATMPTGAVACFRCTWAAGVRPWSTLQPSNAALMWWIRPRDHRQAYRRRAQLALGSGGPSPVTPLRVSQRAWFERDVVSLSHRLLGMVLARRLPDGAVVRGAIVEVEAYPGGDDTASHSFGDEVTWKNRTMFSRPGTAYVYESHRGRSPCFNVCSDVAGVPRAVLIRALKPIEGVSIMAKLRTQASGKQNPRQHHLCSGPGKLCQALSITVKNTDGVDLVAPGSRVWIEWPSDEARQQGAEPVVPDDERAATPRVNVAYAKQDATRLLRFCHTKESRFLSLPVDGPQSKTSPSMIWTWDASCEDGREDSCDDDESAE